MVFFAEEGFSGLGECLGDVQEKILQDKICDIEEALQNAQQVYQLTFLIGIEDLI